MFTLVNSVLIKISSDKVTPKLLIINDIRCHLSFVTFAFTLSFDVLCLFFVHGFIGFRTSIMHGLKAQKRLAQGKRSDALSQSTFVSDTLPNRVPIGCGIKYNQA